MVFKFSRKGELIPGFDTLTPAGQDSALFADSRYIRYLSDSLLLERYMNALLKELRALGVETLLLLPGDSLPAPGPQSYQATVAQVQIDEYLYPLEEEDSFFDTIYYKRFLLNAVDFGTWFELSKSGTASARKTVLYHSGTAYDQFDGRFFNDPFSGMVRYRYSIDTLHVEDVYLLAGYLGEKHAGFLYDFFLNQYIARNLPDGMEPMDYYHYNRNRKSLLPAGEDRFEILDGH